MIDTDKYEGHTEGPWFSWSDYIIKRSWQEPIAEMNFNFKEADARLIADSPLLLAEVKRLREQQKKILEMAELNMALEWGDTDASIEWGAVADIIKGWIE